MMQMRTKPLASQYEMYNLKEDPCEKNNLANNGEHFNNRAKLMEQLQKERQKKRKFRNDPIKRKIIQFTTCDNWCMQITVKKVILSLSVFLIGAFGAKHRFNFLSFIKNFLDFKRR